MIVPDKREIPLQVVREINVFKQAISTPFFLKPIDHWPILICDGRSRDTFFFYAEEYNVAGSNCSYKFGHKPKSAHSLIAATEHSNLDGMTKAFAAWRKLCNEYESSQNPFVDEDELQIENEIFADFRILDDDADRTSFSIPVQIFLNDALDRIKASVGSAEDTLISPDQKQDLIDVISSIQNELPTQTQNGIMRRIANVCAKARKASLKVGNFVLKETAKEIIKEGLKHALHVDPNAVMGWLKIFGEDIAGYLR